MAENEKVYLYVKTPLDSSTRKFRLQSINGSEYISNLFHFTLNVTSKDGNINFINLLGENITITIEQYNTKMRLVNGVVTRLTQSNKSVYTIDIRPWLWELTLTSNSKIFQNKTVPEIIKQIFQDFGFTDFTDKLSGTYKPKDYCVQYQETAFNFISRLMEEEGIYYYFEHTDSAHKLILADDMDAHEDCPTLSETRMKLTSLENDERVESCTLEEVITTTQYGIDDYNFETPESDLMVNSKSSGKLKLRVYEYPGRYEKKNDADPITKRRLESHLLQSKLISGTGFVRSFTAGYKISISEHDRKDINGSYVLESVSLSANQNGYSNTFNAFPSNVQYRAPVVSRKPKIFGSQTALVVGKKGEEIWTDKYGRIKVQFHWDQDGKKDENSSCWIRVAQNWAGKGWGFWYIPRIGMEVVVSFLEGDPDKPLVTGCVYNATQTLPYSLPANQNISTILSRSTKKGNAGNEIKFDDTKDSENFYMHAQKDMNVEVENERNTTIIESNETLTVKKGDRTIKVETGKELHEVKDTRTVNITGDETHNNKGNFTHNVKGNYNLNVDGNLTIKVKGSISIKGDMDISTKAGTSISTEAGTTMENKASISMTNDGGVNLTDKASAMVTISGGIVKIN